MLNIFYEEPDGDRWVLFDRYARRIIRRAWETPPGRSNARVPEPVRRVRIGILTE